MKRVRKTMWKLWTGVLLFIGMIVWLPIQVWAAQTEVEIDMPEGYSKAVFYVTWENYEQPGTIVLTSPSGKVYSKKKTPDQVYEANGEAIIHVGKGEEGTWKAAVTGENLGVVDVTIGEVPDSLVISKFEISEKGTGSVKVNYKITDCPDELYVEVFADTDSEGFDGTCVYSDNMEKSGSFTFDLDQLPSGEYHFYIRVSVDGVYQRAYSDAFISYQNPEDVEKVSGVKGGTYNDGYYISWKASNEEAYTVRVYDEAHNLIREEEQGTTDFYYDDFTGDASKVYLAVIRTDENCRYELVSADAAVKADADVVFDTDADRTKSSFIQATVTMQDKNTFDAYLGDERILTDEKENGMYRVNLKDGDNTVTFVITDPAGNTVEYSQEIYVDTVPPQLSISEDVDGKVVTENTIYLNGYTEAGASLTLNGEPVELTQSYFHKKVSLANGENTLELIAEDAVENQSVYRAVVTYEAAKTVKRVFEYVILGGLVLVLLILYIIVFVKGRKRRKQS